MPNYSPSRRNNDHYHYNDRSPTTSTMNRRESSHRNRDPNPKEKHYVYKQEKHYIFNQKQSKPLNRQELHEQNYRQQQEYEKERDYHHRGYDKRDKNYPDKIHVRDHNDSISRLGDDTAFTSSSPSFPYFDPENVKDDGTTIEWCVDLPGVEPETLKAVFHEKTFTLSGCRNSGGMKAFGSEFDVDVTAIDTDSIKANLRHGVLIIKADKIKRKPPRDIPITSYENEEEEEEGRKKEEALSKKQELAKKRLEELKRKKQAELKRNKDLDQKLVEAIPEPDEFVSLLVEIMSAKDLLKADLLGKSDPYVRIALDGNDVHQTKFIRQTLNPKWTEGHKNKFVWNGKAKNLQRAGGFVFLLMDHDTFSADDPLGDFCVAMEDLVTMNGRAVEYDVTPPAHKRTETETAGSCKIRVSLACAADRKKYSAVSNKVFWEPPKDAVLELYRKEKIDKKMDDTSNNSNNHRSSVRQSVSSSSSLKAPSQRKPIKKMPSKDTGGGMC